MEAKSASAIVLEVKKMRGFKKAHRMNWLVNRDSLYAIGLKAR